MLSLALGLALASMPPGTYCSTWSVGALHEEGDRNVSNDCTCRSWTTYSGPRCLECSPRLLADGGDNGTGTCTRFEEQRGCAVAPGLAPALALLWLRLRRARARPLCRATPTSR